MEPKALKQAMEEAKNANFHITPVKMGTGKIGWRVEGRQRGKRYRKAFFDRERAEDHCQQMSIRALDFDALPKFPVLTRLTAEQVHIAEQAYERLGELPASGLIDAVVDYTNPKKLTTERLAMAHRAFDLLEDAPANELIEAVTEHQKSKKQNAAIKAVTVSTAVEEFLADKKLENVRARTIGDLRARLHKFAETNGAKKVSNVNNNDVKTYMQAGEKAPQTQKNNLTVVSAFFAWAVVKEYTLSNPCKTVKPPNMDDSEPVVLSIEQIKKVLESAQTERDGRCLPWVVLGLFCAVRPAEIARLEETGTRWKAVDLQNKQIRIGPEIAKLRGRRVIELDDAAVAWLELVKGKSMEPNRRDLDHVKRVAGFLPRRTKSNSKNPDKAEKFEARDEGLTEWPGDCLRHTAISYHLELHKNEGKTAVWAGNSPGVIQKHYRALVTPQQTTEFWNIKPQSK